MRTLALLALILFAAVGCSDIFGSSDRPREPNLPSIGDVLTFNVPVTGENACSATPDERAGRVVEITSKTIVVVDTANPSSQVTDSEYGTFGRDFDRWGFSVVEQYFGAPTDLDENNRVIAFFTRAVNERADPEGNSVIWGMFWPGDLFPSTSQDNFQGCANSNYAEIFYMAVPDPNGQVGPRISVDAVRRNAVSTMGHELQHLVNAARRLYEPPLAPSGDLFEAVWLNEGLSHITEELMFFERANAGPGTNIDINWLRGSESRRDAFNMFQIQNFSRFALLLEDPDDADASLVSSDAALASRGANWHFLRYAADRHGEQVDLWWDLVNTTRSGMANLAAALGANVDDWVRDWSAAVFADDEAPVDPQFEFPSWNMRAIYPAFEDNGRPVYPDGYPLAIRMLDDGEPVDLDLTAMTAAYLQVGVTAGDTATITFTSGDSEPPAALQVSVVNTATGEVRQFSGSEAGTIRLEAAGSDALYVLVPLHASAAAQARLALHVESERATPPTVASVAPYRESDVALGPLFSAGAASASVPAIDHSFHVEFLERAQRELAPLIPHARDVYRQRQVERGPEGRMP